MNRCKCGRITPVEVFCSTKCREASENKSFKTYAINMNLIISAPDDIESVKRAIDFVEFFRDVENIVTSFEKVAEISGDSIKCRELDLETIIFKILTEQNSKE